MRQSTSGHYRTRITFEGIEIKAISGECMLASAAILEAVCIPASIVKNTSSGHAKSVCDP